MTEEAINDWCCEVLLIGPLRTYFDDTPRFIARRPDRNAPEVTVEATVECIHEQWTESLLAKIHVRLPGHADSWPTEVTHATQTAEEDYGWAVIKYRLDEAGNAPALITALRAGEPT